MNVSQWLLILCIGIPLLLAAFNRLRMDLAALTIAVLLGMLQFIGFGILGSLQTPQASIEAIAGFSQPVVMTLISLFIITKALEKQGITTWLAGRVSRLGGKSEPLTIAILTGASAFLSLFMNNVAAGALVLPAALCVANQSGIKAGKLLIPVAYGSLLGGMATYFTTANIIMADMVLASNAGLKPIDFLDFLPTGGLITLGGIAFLAIFGKSLLPNSPQHVDLCQPDINTHPPIKPLSAGITVGVALTALAASIAGVPVYLATLAGAVLLMVVRVISVQEAYHSVEWPAIFLIAGMYTASQGIIHTGLAALLAQNVLSLTAHFGGFGVAVTGFLLAAIINQFIGGQVTAYVVGPVMLSAAAHLNVDLRAVAVAVAIGCSTSFLTPIAHPVNMLMVVPGGYRFSDFIRTGCWLTLIALLLLGIGLKIFWGL